MMRRLLVASAMAGALLMAGAAPRSAEALPLSKLQVATDSGSDVTLAKRRGGGGFKGGGRGFKGGGRAFKGGGKAFRGFSGGGSRRFKANRGGFSKGYFKGRKGHRRGPKIRFRSRSYGYVPYYYDSYYDDSCAWLRRRALRTGSRYWWRRYERCRHDYY